MCVCVCSNIILVVLCLRVHMCVPSNVVLVFLVCACVCLCACMCVCVCVCVCVCMCVCVRVYVYVCMYVRVREREREKEPSKVALVTGKFNCGNRCTSKALKGLSPWLLSAMFCTARVLGLIPLEQVRAHV